MSTLQCIGLLLVAPLFISFTATATRIFCRAPPVFAGDPATLTCYFPEDLSQSKKSVSVYGRDVNGSQAELVIGCVWGGEKLVCDANEGFTLLPQKIDYEITFGIPSHKPGTFRCDYIPPDKAVTVQSCNLTLKGRLPSSVTPSRPDSPTQSTERSLGRNEDGATRIFCRAPPVPVGDPATLTCHFPQDLSQSRKGIGVARRDSIPGSQYGFLLGCIWDGEKLRCGVRDGYQLITQQPTYDVTFQIPSHQPGTFLCDYIPEDEAVIVEACNFTLKGSPPTTVTPSRPDSPTQSTERSLGRNEDGDRRVVTIIVLAVVLFVITAVAAIPLTVLHCWLRSAKSASPLFLKHGKEKIQIQVVEQEAQSFLTHGTDRPEPDN